MPFEYDSFGMIGQDIRGITLSFWCQRSSVFYGAFCITRMKISPSQRGVPVDFCRYEHQERAVHIPQCTWPIVCKLRIGSMNGRRLEKCPAGLGWSLFMLILATPSSNDMLDEVVAQDFSRFHTHLKKCIFKTNQCLKDR
jgi:hypothetical protein